VYYGTTVAACAQLDVSADTAAPPKLRVGRLQHYRGRRRTGHFVRRRNRAATGAAAFGSVESGGWWFGLPRTISACQPQTR
jgi:hypothetical protein